MMSYTTLGFALIGGILPAIIWLYFILKEDERCPEPQPLIIIAFFTGVLAVAFALPLEQLAKTVLSGELSVLVSWAAIEEVLKYGLVALAVLWRKAVNEPIDLVIYMITAALGFAALENVLFFLQALTTHGFWGSAGALATGNLRFIGSTLLHVVASATVGFAMAFAFRKSMMTRTAFVTVGLVLAIALHTAFNFLIISGDGTRTLFAFFIVWSGAILFFAIFEALKYIRYRSLPTNTC
jgi:protease PrsW